MLQADLHRPNTPESSSLVTGAPLLGCAGSPPSFEWDPVSFPFWRSWRSWSP